MYEILARDCPPGSGIPVVPSPVGSVSPPIRVQLPPESAAVDDCPPTSGPEGARADCPQRPADEPESILDEVADDIGSSAPDASTPAPVPRADRSTLIGARAALRAAVERCDPLAYGAAKQRLLGLLDQLISQEVDAVRREALETERNALRDSEVPICGEQPTVDDPEPPPPPVVVPESGQQAAFWSPWGDYLYVAGGVGETDVPQTGAGVTRGGSAGVVPEADAGLGADRVSTIGVEAMLGLGNIRLRGGYSEGDASTSFSVQPISGGFNGAVFGALSPSGSSGIGAGSASLVGTTEVEVSQFKLGVDAAIAQPSPATRIFVSFDYFREVRRYGSTLNGTVGSGTSAITFFQVRDQEVVDNGLGLGLTLEFNTTLVTDSGVTFSGSITVQGLVLDSGLTSTERNSSNFGPASDRDFTIVIEESDTSFGIAGAARAELGYSLSPGFSIFAGGSVSYRDRTGGVFNPNSGNQVFLDGLTTGLIRNDFWSYEARIGFRASLGRR